MRSPYALASLSLLALAGCHSAYVETTVSNRSSQTMRLIEVDYPSASFGTQALAPGADFHYRFKVMGEGKMKIIWTDPSNHEKTAEGISLQEGAEGPITISISDDGAHWQDNTKKK